MSNEFKALSTVGISLSSIQFLSYVIVFVNSEWADIANSVNLGAIILQIIWLISATIIRLKHTGKVCSGDFLHGQATIPYLIEQGRFWKRLVIACWGIPLGLFTVGTILSIYFSF